MNWIAVLSPPKYLRYFFAIAYSWYKPYKSERADAHITATIFLALPHIALFFFIADIVSSDMVIFTNIQVVIVSLLILLLHYFLFLYKRKWCLYIKEFGNLKKNDKKLGTIYLLIYLLSWFFLALFPVF